MGRDKNISESRLRDCIEIRRRRLKPQQQAHETCLRRLKEKLKRKAQKKSSKEKLKRKAA
jgi:hypothetical protein